jgi:hypothetical protein
MVNYVFIDRGLLMGAEIIIFEWHDITSYLKDIETEGQKKAVLSENILA